jgi:uncharacterized protein YkwD
VLRTPLLAAALLAVPALALAASAVAAPVVVTAKADQKLAGSVLAALNAVRAEDGRPRLTTSDRLAAAAGRHSLEMAEAGYFARESRDGTAFWRRIDRSYGSAGRAYWSVGENLLWSSPDVDATAALRLWMASPHHRENILTAR